MIAKCPKCRFVRIRGMRETCPHCRSRLSRPTVAELREFEDSVMEHTRAARCLVEASDSDETLKLVAFMATVEGRNLTRAEAARMLEP